MPDLPKPPPGRYQELRDYYEHAATRTLSEAGLPVSRLRLPSEQRWPAALTIPDCVDELEPEAVPRGFVCPITQVGLKPVKNTVMSGLLRGVRVRASRQRGSLVAARRG